jgi:hypothetical protein
MAVNLALLLAAIGRIRSSRFSGNRRAGTRLPVHVPVRLAGQRGELLDVSVTGARIRVPASVDGDSGELWLTVELPGRSVELLVDIRRTQIRDGSVVLGLEFRRGQERSIGALAVGIFHADVAVAGTPRRRRDGLVWEGAAA